jgi:NDP-sugar pyrophosphorylase family protein
MILMAGKGNRFTEKGYCVPKPMVMVNGKTILQWTTESCPFIKHNVKEQDKTINLCFAVLKEHLEDGVGEFLKSIYGENITIIPFDQVTRGNLETARIACDKIKFSNSPILFLDSDNKYDHSGMDTFFSSLPSDLSTMAICCFDDENKKLPNKWCNARIKNNLAIELREKDDNWINYPALIGTFYFSRVDQFKNYADFIMDNLAPIGPENKEEYYMSMLPKHHAKIGQPVHVHMVNSVVPLGTPEDVNIFMMKGKE